jgi:hypothetical protein
MATYGDMKTRIASEMHREDISTQIAEAILSAVEFYSASRFAGNEARGTITTIAGTKFYGTDTASPGTLPSDIAEIDQISLTVSGRTYALDRQPHSLIESIDSVSLQATPRDWAWYAGQLRLYPTPNDAYTVTLSYQQILTALSADNDSNFWTNDAEQLIRCRAKRMLCMHVTGDQETANAMFVAEREALSQLKKKTNKLEASGRIRATPF